MFTHIKNFISQEDIDIVNDYIKTIKFNTKEDHVPLHDALFEKYNAPFDLHTRGEMPQHILEIFSKYSKGFYELIQSKESKEYHPPMFSKHYIARYNEGVETGPQFDTSKPENTYKSYIYWNDNFDGGELDFPTLGYIVKPNPGDLIYFIDNEENKVAITKITSGVLYLSEAWMGTKGQLFMPSAEPYERIDWDNWEIKGF